MSTPTPERAPWAPSVMEGDVLDLETIVGQAIGTGSMCWKETPTGIFDSDQALWVMRGAVAAIKKLEAPGGGED